MSSNADSLSPVSLLKSFLHFFLRCYCIVNSDVDDKLITVTCFITTVDMSLQTSFGTQSLARTDFTDYLTVHRLSLLNGFTFFSFFSNFSFQNLFPLQLFF